MTKKHLSELASACAFRTILANVHNPKMNDTEFREFIAHTWAENVEDKFKPKSKVSTTP
jgi:hypothetical protein